MDGVVERYTTLLRNVFEGRRVILAATPLAGSTRRVAALRELGAARCFVLATGLGTGDVPDETDADHLVLELTAHDVMDEFRQVERILASPPTEAIAALDQFDPDHGALVVLAPFSVSAGVGARGAYGGRRQGWVTLEDKTVCDALFDAADVARPPAAIVAPDGPALLAASDLLDQGAGVVWSGDARDGFNGGGVFVRWIRADRPATDVVEAVEHFALACGRVRVAPFIEGVPCSIHGFACDDGIAVLRPVELVNLRPPTGARLRYAGAATFFDPPAADREAMRDAARRVGTHLVEHHAFRGAFTIDGILGMDGWLPTELNPRFGAGLGYVAAALPDLPFDLLHHIVVAGDGHGVSAADLEALVVPGSDERRWGGGWSTTSARFARTESTPITFAHDGTTCRRAADGGVPDGELLTGPGAEGGFVRITLDPDRTPIGPSVAPRIVAALAFADDELGTAIGPLSAPIAVREQSPPVH